jgi:hypothetical protein
MISKHLQFLNHNLGLKNLSVKPSASLEKNARKDCKANAFLSTLPPMLKAKYPERTLKKMISKWGSTNRKCHANLEIDALSSLLESALIGTKRHKPLKSIKSLRFHKPSQPLKLSLPLKQFLALNIFRPPREKKSISVLWILYA